jgi:lysophospholipase L1-like esterase
VDQTVSNVGLPEEKFGILQADPDLLWSLKPSFRGLVRGASVSINAQGLRGPEIGKKQQGEIRILCLGESTTFGIKVDQGRDYPHVLESLLRKQFPERNITVINAGVVAYSSYQSWQFLLKRGLRLEPDIVVLYHEVNDYLPSTLRNEDQVLVGNLQTDWKLQTSPLFRVTRELWSVSVLYRWLESKYLESRISRFEASPVVNPLLTIGLPDIGIPPRLLTNGNEHLLTDERRVGQRVSEEERQKILSEFERICRENRIRLVVIHPAYADSTPHECLLTRFCRERNVLLLDAYPTLHPSPGQAQGMFLDLWHPSADGHRRLAEALAQFIVQHDLLDARGNRPSGARRASPM